MKKLLTLLLALGLVLCLSVTAWADYDYIDRYDVTVTPDTDDGSLNITVSLEWTALEALPYGQKLKIGIPNGSIPEVTALTDNIERLDYDNSFMYVYLNRAYDDGETFTFSYSWVQEYMYTLDGGTVSYDYTPGWFDEAQIGEMTLTWNDPAGVTGDFGNTSNAAGEVNLTGGGMVMTAQNLGHGQTMTVSVRYDSWPTALDQSFSAGNVPVDYVDYDDWYDEDEDTSMAALFLTLIITIFIVWAVVWILRELGDGYAGGFGTRYVFVNHLWYPAGPDGKPRPGSVGTKTRPRPPRSGGGGFGGGSRGGGFSGGGFGGGGHCACASSCACACACACAGGGRAGCSAKNLYGAVKLSREVTERLEE